MVSRVTRFGEVKVIGTLKEVAGMLFSITVVVVAGACNQLYSHGLGRKSLHEWRSLRLGSLDGVASPVRAVTSGSHSCDARNQEQASRYFLRLGHEIDEREASRGDRSSVRGWLANQNKTANQYVLVVPC